MSGLPAEVDEARAEVVHFARRMVTDRLVRGTSGNISRRVGQFVAITPGAVEYDVLTDEDVVVMTVGGDRVAGRRNPSSETPLHLGIYRRTPASAVVHTHSTFATVVGVVAEELPSVHYMTASMGPGAVPVVPYSRYGSEELARSVGEALADRSAVLMGNHGAVAHGASLLQAYNRAQNLEWMCEVFVNSMSIGAPRLLGDAEIGMVAERMRTRGYLGSVEPIGEGEAR
ncbi:class II aldolase/adducin family protein [Homoserinibacter sp. GY 40078]|uniref:class II aldolase/adducin family protein n=1 Tax=Homoserinibacter sp. GY 40078 TaxID=2603275 RepID=UPI0011C85FD7|nr:class II aldolase/adducin family protein [Homoserinibacter sp. GY 40078]TXK19251.1 class II aldolase/adducin family protein [Homoserinibacter sp. GY 40078]